MNNSVESKKDKGNKAECKQKGYLEWILQRKQKGCGFRLHFCMDNKKRSQVKSGNMTHSTEGVSSDKTITSSTKNEATLKNPTPSNPIQNTVTRRNVNLPGFNQSTEVLRSQGKFEDKTKEEPKNPTAQNRQSILKGVKKTSSQISLKNPNNDSAQTGQKIQFSSQEKHIDTRELEKALGIKKVPNEFDLQDESATPKEFEMSRKSIRRKSTMKRGSFQNFTSLRRKTTLTSSFPCMAIPEILSKLCMIEDRISNLEKNRKDQGNIKNIVGVSCKRKNVELKNMEENGQCSSTALPFKSNTTVVIKVCGDDVVVDKVEGNEEKKKQVLQWGESEQLVYQNIENNNTVSMEKLPFSNSVQNKQTKTIVKVYSQTSGPMKKQSSKSWEKVSQELKLLPSRN